MTRERAGLRVTFKVVAGVTTDVKVTDLDFKTLPRGVRITIAAGYNSKIPWEKS